MQRGALSGKDLKTNQTFLTTHSAQRTQLAESGFFPAAVCDLCRRRHSLACALSRSSKGRNLTPRCLQKCSTNPGGGINSHDQWFNRLLIQGNPFGTQGRACRRNLGRWFARFLTKAAVSFHPLNP